MRGAAAESMGSREDITNIIGPIEPGLSGVMHIDEDEIETVLIDSIEYQSDEALAEDENMTTADAIEVIGAVQTSGLRKAFPVLEFIQNLIVENLTQTTNQEFHQFNEYLLRLLAGYPTRGIVRRFTLTKPELEQLAAIGSAAEWILTQKYRISTAESDSIEAFVLAITKVTRTD